MGRSRLIYSLTVKGIEKFSIQHLHLTLRVLEILKNSLSNASYQTMFEEMGSEITKPYLKNQDKKSINERLKTIEDALKKEG